MVIVAISTITLLLIVSLVIDGGRAFAARRTAQNASDSAALAGAQALFSYQYAVARGLATVPPASGIQTATFAKLTQNGAPTNQTCDYVSAAGFVLAACSTTPPPATAAGVRASGSLGQKTNFAPTAKIFTAVGTSIATIQPLIGTSAPFIVCGASTDSWPILDPAPEGQLPTINVANALAAGTQPLQAASIARCGAGATFKGKALPNQAMVVGQEVNGDNGNGYDGEISDGVAGAVPCPPPPAEVLDCDMLLPIADTGYGNGNDVIKLHVAAFGIFRVTGNGGTENPKYYGTFRAPSVLATGGTGLRGGYCNAGAAVCVVKLFA